MENTSIVSLKIFLVQNESDEPEIRRFALPSKEMSSYMQFAVKVAEVFPSLTGKMFKIYWIDEEGDNVVISTDVELLVAAMSMKGPVKKFYVKPSEPTSESGRRQQRRNSGEGVEKPVLHPDVYCDGCELEIAGVRYKCVKCDDYDLCKSCEKEGIHDDHPMVKIPTPSCFERAHLRMLLELMRRVVIPVTGAGHRRRHHSHDASRSDSHKKKKRSEKRESGPDSGDEMDEGCHKKHLHKKCKKGKCPVKIYFQSACDEQKKAPGDSGHMAYLKSVGSTITKLLDPLGVTVELDVRTNVEKPEEKKEEGKKKEEETTKPRVPEKEVRFPFGQETVESVRQGVEEITKILASQTMTNSNNNENNENNGGSNRNSPENDGWVSYEELKRGSDEGKQGPSGESTPRQEQQEGKVPESSSPRPQTQNLYPELNPPASNLNSGEVAEALAKLISMGFTDQENVLTRLLEANAADISQVLEALLPDKQK